MKIDALDHPKTIDFALRLDVCLPQAIGHLEFLWAFVAQKTPRGDIGKWSNGVIASAAKWDGDPDDFVKAAVGAGYIDESDEYRLVVHDWHEHMPNWVRSKLARSKLTPVTVNEEVNPQVIDSKEQEISGDLSSDLTSDYKSGEAKPSQAKGSEASDAREESEALDGEKPITRAEILDRLSLAGVPAKWTQRMDDQAIVNRWVQQRITMPILAEAIARACDSKQGEPFGVKYLAPIVGSIISGGGNAQRKGSGKSGVERNLEATQRLASSLYANG